MPVLAVIGSAVVLPSGATTAFAVTVADAAVLVPRRHGEVFGVLRHVLEGTADRPVRPALDGLEVRVWYAHRLLAAAYAKFAPPDPVAQDHGARRRGGGRVADLRRRVRVDRRRLARQSVTRLVTSASAWVWGRSRPWPRAPVPGRRCSPRRRARARPSRQIGREAVMSASAWVCADDASATVTFTRSLAGTSANVRPMSAPWIRFNARRVPTAAPFSGS